MTYIISYVAKDSIRAESRQRRVYNPQLVAVYHQCEALYIIKPQVDTRWRVMRYKGGMPPLMICRLASDDMPSLRLG